MPVQHTDQLTITRFKTHLDGEYSVTQSELKSQSKTSELSF